MAYLDVQSGHTEGNADRDVVGEAGGEHAERRRAAGAGHHDAGEDEVGEEVPLHACCTRFERLNHRRGRAQVVRAEYGEEGGCLPIMTQIMVVVIERGYYKCCVRYR